MAKGGQTSLEMTVALVMVMMLLLASVKIFLWLNQRIVIQQVDYENTRVQAGNGYIGNIDITSSADMEGLPHNATPTEALNIFR